jgi:hypothetical protein
MLGRGGRVEATDRGPDLGALGYIKSLVVVVRLASLLGWRNLQGCSNNATEHASSALIFGLVPIMRSTRINPSPSRAGPYLHPIHHHHARPFLCALGHRLALVVLVRLGSLPGWRRVATTHVYKHKRVSADYLDAWRDA